MVRAMCESGRRGQVLLVGAVALAFILIGLAVVFNAVTYTGQTSVPEAGSSLDDAGQFDFEARRGARELVLRVNHAGVYGTQSELARNVSANVSNYSAVMGATYSGHGAAVNVSFENASSDYGRRIVQDQEATLNNTNAPVTADWQLVNESERLGWFVVTLNGTDLAENPENAFRINVTNDTEYVEYRFYGQGDGVITVSVNGSLESNETHQFNTTRGHVTFDLLDGTSPMNRSAGMGSLRRLTRPYNVTFSNGDRAKGLYSIVVRSENNVSDTIAPCSASTPCHGPALWNVTLKTNYESPSISVRHNQTVPVYNSTS
jgi:hypothetical protein